MKRCLHLATRGTRSCADGTVRAPGVINHSRPSALLATRRCDLVKPAKGGSRFWALQRSQEEARPSKTQRYDEGCFLDLILEWVGRSVFGNVECARSPTYLDFHEPTSGQCSAARCCGNWTGHSDPLPTSSLRRQRGHGSAVSNVGCCSQKRGAWSQARSMHRNEHSSRVAAGYGKLAPQVRTLCEECEKHFRQIMVGSRHLVRRTRQELMLLREAVSA